MQKSEEGKPQSIKLNRPVSVLGGPGPRIVGRFPGIRWAYPLTGIGARYSYVSFAVERLGFIADRCPSEVMLGIEPARVMCYPLP